MPDPERTDKSAERRTRSSAAGDAKVDDRSPWNWLLLVPIVVPLVTPLYDGAEPYLFGFPRFYWMQLAFLGLGVICTTVVYRMTRRRR